MADRIFCSGERHRSGGPGRFYLGDAREAARMLLAEYSGKIQTVCLDPPFGTGGTFTARIGQERVTVPAYEDRLDLNEYMALMEAVLIASRVLMCDTGSLYLHADWRMTSHLRLLMDRIFGRDNFINEIVWAYKSGGRSTKRYSRKHDTILFYGKSDDFYFDIEAVGIPRGPERRNHMKREVDALGRVIYTIHSGGKTYTYGEDMPVYPTDVWDDIEHLHQRDPERTGYSTQKPLALLKRMILASSREGDTVMDLFSGSGTTADAAAALGRKWITADASRAALLTLRRRLLAKDLSMLSGVGEMELLYLSPMGDAKEPDFLVERNGNQVTLTPQDDSLAYVAVGGLNGDLFCPYGYEMDPRRGKPVRFDGDNCLLQTSDAFGNMGLWRY